MAATNYTPVFKLPLPIGTDTIARADVLSISNGVENNAVARIEASAAVIGNTLSIISEITRSGVNYEVQFIAPENYRSSRSLVIDDVQMEGLFGMNGEPIENDTWHNSSPVKLTRIGSRAYLLGGGGGISSADKARLVYKDSPVVNDMDSAGRRLRNCEVQDTAGNQVSGGAWIRFRRG